MLKPVKDLAEYKRIKQALRNEFDKDRTGDQHLFLEQSKLFKPLIEPLLASQEQTIKAIQKSPQMVMPAIMGENEVRMALPPMISSSSNNTESIKIDLDSGLNDIDIQHLEDMNFDLPSEVFKRKRIK